MYISSELAFTVLNFDLPWLSFGRLRLLHTNDVIFAFGGNLVFMGFLLIFFFVWAAKNGQFEDLETQKYRIFFEKEK